MATRHSILQLLEAIFQSRDMTNQSRPTCIDLLHDLWLNFALVTVQSCEVVRVEMYSDLSLRCRMRNRPVRLSDD